MTTSPSPANSQASNPSHYARLIARELGLQAPDLGRLLPNTGLSVEQLLDEIGRAHV